MTLERAARQLRQILIARKRMDLPDEMRRRLGNLERLSRLNLAAQKALRLRRDAPTRLTRLP